MPCLPTGLGRGRHGFRPLRPFRLPVEQLHGVGVYLRHVSGGPALLVCPCAYLALYVHGAAFPHIVLRHHGERSAAHDVVPLRLFRDLVPVLRPVGPVGGRHREQDTLASVLEFHHSGVCPHVAQDDRSVYSVHFFPVCLMGCSLLRHRDLSALHMLEHTLSGAARHDGSPVRVPGTGTVMPALLSHGAAHTPAFPLFFHCPGQITVFIGFFCF